MKEHIGSRLRVAELRSTEEMRVEIVEEPGDAKAEAHIRARPVRRSAPAPLQTVQRLSHSGNRLQLDAHHVFETAREVIDESGGYGPSESLPSTLQPSTHRAPGKLAKNRLIVEAKAELGEHVHEKPIYEGLAMLQKVNIAGAQKA
jgi:hypothetical protein